MAAAMFCKVMSVIFIIIGVWGFIAGDRVLIFHVNTLHNVVHLASGVGALACGMIGERVSRWFCFAFGTVYGLVAILGFAGVVRVVELLHLNEADNWLHVGIAAAFLVAGTMSQLGMHRPGRAVLRPAA